MTRAVNKYFISRTAPTAIFMYEYNETFASYYIICVTSGARVACDEQIVYAERVVK